jgi:uncharacterized phage protein (TIGR02220 family)
MDKKSFFLYTSQRELTQKLNTEQKANLLDAIYYYAEFGEMVKMDGMTELVMITIKQAIDRDSEKYQRIVTRNQENIKKRYSSKSTSGSFGKPNLPEATLNGNVNVNENENVIKEKHKKEKPKKIDYSDDAFFVLGYLNTKTRSAYRPVNTNIDLITARLKSDISKDQLIAIIDLKCRQWLNDDEKMVWLRPATLFGKTKCEQYLGELNRLKNRRE